MIQKTIVVIAASALACGLWASGASAATRHYAKHKVQRTTVAKAEPMKAVPGNNPFSVAPTSAPVAGAKNSDAIKGNNPMVSATAAPTVQGSKAPEAIKGNNAMGVK